MPNTTKETLPLDHKERILVVAVDLDGLLCHGALWGKNTDPKPKKAHIKKVREMYLSGRYFIVIYTSRIEEWRATTVEWLSRHRVLYHALQMGKLWADIYVDDKAKSNFRGL